MSIDYYYITSNSAGTRALTHVQPLGRQVLSKANGAPAQAKLVSQLFYDKRSTGYQVTAA
jgi:hypothetical protein